MLLIQDSASVGHVCVSCECWVREEELVSETSPFLLETRLLAESVGLVDVITSSHGAQLNLFPGKRGSGARLDPANYTEPRRSGD